jgi:Fe-S-cluster containining protein
LIVVCNFEEPTQLLWRKQRGVSNAKNTLLQSLSSLSFWTVRSTPTLALNDLSAPVFLHSLVRYSQIVSYRFPAAADRQLIQIVDAALAETTRRSGEWLACRPGCTQCCIGAFPINQLDAWRLRRGMAALEATVPSKAEAIRKRAEEYLSRIRKDFPGNLETGVLDESEEASERFDDFANNEVCPVLDPGSGLCELYESRPMTCRVFGPPVRSEDGLGVCELCFNGATEEQIRSCEMIPDPDNQELSLLKKVEDRTGLRGYTIIPFALTQR